MPKYFIIPILFLNLFSGIAQEKVSPLQIETTYVGEYFSNFSGGIKTGQTYLGLLDFGLSLKTENIGLWKNGEYHIQIENTHGGRPSAEYIGDIQIASNIENGDFTYLYELWYKQNFSKLSIKFGIIDLNAECHVTELGGLFLNSSCGIMPSASLNMPVPIFPIPALGIQIKYNFSDRFSVLAGIWDGDPGDFEHNRYNIEWTLNNRDGFLYLFEVKFRYRSEVDNGLGKIKFGGLYHSGQFKDLADSISTKNGNIQLHLIAEHTLINKSEGERGKLDVFMQLGYLPDNSISMAPLYFGFGINYKGIFLKSGSDLLGLAIANTLVNKQLADNFDILSHETAIELSYSLPLCKKITIQPDVQYIINPGAANKLQNAFVGFLRFVISY